MRKIILLSILISLIVNVIKAQSEETKQWILDHSKEYYNESKSTAISLGYIVDNQINTINLGHLGKDRTDTVTNSTVYEIGSISKTFLGVLVQQAIIDGKLDMSEDIRRYYPQDQKLSTDVPPITIQDLATHHSSLPRLPGNIWNKKGFDMTNPYALYDSLAMYSFLEKYYAQNPKKDYAYSNFGAGLLGHLVALQYNEDTEQLLQRIICKPLAMSQTSIKNVSDLPIASIAQAHNNRGEVAINWDFDVLATAGGIKSNIDDMMKYAKVYLIGNALVDNPFAEALVPQRKMQDNGSIATFWHHANFKNIDIIHHSGMTGGYASTMVLDTKNNIAIVALTNSANSIEPLVLDILEQLNIE